MTRAHANAHWQRICSEQDRRANKRLCAADRERAIRAHERAQQVLLADQELARELLEIEEDHQRRTVRVELELEALRDENQFQEDLKLQHPASPPSGPSGRSIRGAARQQKYEKPALRAARKPKHQTPAREEIVADREDTDFAESNTDAHPHTPDLSPSPPPPTLAVRSGGSTHAPPKRMPAVKSDMRRTTPTIVPSSPAVKSLKSSTRTRTPATRPEATPKTKTKAPTPKIKIKTEAPVPDIKVEAPTPALKTGPRTRPLIASSNTCKHDITAEAPTPILKTGPRTRPLIASSNVHEHDARAEVPTPAIKAGSHTRPLIVSSKAHEPDMGEPRTERKSTRMHLTKSEGWGHTQHEFGQAVTHAHALHVNRPAPLLESDEEDIAAGKESALPTRTHASHIEHPAPLFEKDESDKAASDRSASPAPSPTLPMEHPASNAPLIPITYQNSTWLMRPSSPSPPAAPSNHKRTISPETTLPVVMIDSDSAPTSPDTSTISRSMSSVSSLSLSSSSPTAVSVQAGKRQKLVMLPAAHTESASAPLAAASSSRPLIFVNQSTRATYRSYKVAIDAMAVDESVVPMDLEEATKMISAAGDR
ncbi:hypothetical protein DFH08DRAFT_813287 [Mycena albidolilacea]|uniref:Uncharacterized protein n=1 Tax=Mycena albidolilacea TaxID=1033008 RepID=A0AAD6ZSI8_9AGAR|nr:hypothetical protein DFH08DRAFT_813287 [Mycena albidolilacea]